VKETFFIILVAIVLFGLTAIRYRRQIVAFLTFYKQLKAAGTNLREGGIADRQHKVKGIQLVRCSKCGKFVPESETINGGAKPVCRSGCALTNAA